MWNSINTADYEGMIAETITYQNAQGESVRGYLSRPLGAGKYPGIVLIPHMPGWDEWCRETARRFTQHGYAALCPDIYGRFGTGAPPEVSAKAREAGGVPDDSVMSDSEGAMNFLKSQPYSNGKVGVIGMCSGGRHAFMAACRVNGFDAAVNCWGGGVIAPKEYLTPANPVSALDYTPQLSCPLLGIFGNEDKFPAPDQVDILEAELKKYKKEYQFHRYDNCGHGFWYYDRDAYRPKEAMESWDITLQFFADNLS